ncbi:hypothetical protein [Rheinheimera sp. 1928-s]|uniref:hypothetical protein n=1 Tax=Rheinheimera sp. 1928-s TaxID=3033803 RepID=UPI002619760C|nr:hypothetical protein [Rheinheimera sp. 1928-s]MDF3127384.1 hypothetical protein [Rheinheimera sp. 1928-s]
MSSENISLLSLAISLAAFYLSFIAYRADKAVVSVRATLFEDHSNLGNFDAVISVSNHGKRPVSLSFVRITKPDGQSFWVPFNANGGEKLDVGEAKSHVVPHSFKGLSVRDHKEWFEHMLFVQDALGGLHYAPWPGQGKIKTTIKLWHEKIRRFFRKHKK